MFGHSKNIIQKVPYDYLDETCSGRLLSAIISCSDLVLLQNSRESNFETSQEKNHTRCVSVSHAMKKVYIAGGHVKELIKKI